MDVNFIRPYVGKHEKRHAEGLVVFIADEPRTDPITATQGYAIFACMLSVIAFIVSLAAAVS